MRVELEFTPQEMTHADQAFGDRIRYDHVRDEKVVPLVDGTVLVLRKVRRDG